MTDELGSDSPEIPVDTSSVEYLQQRQAAMQMHPAGKRLQHEPPH